MPLPPLGLNRNDYGFLWAVNPKAEPLETGSRSTPNTLFQSLLTVPHVATRAVI